MTWLEKIQQAAIRGTPDHLGCLAGRFIALEFKFGAGKPDPLQQRKLKLIESAGGIALVVNEKNAEEVYEQLRNAKRCECCGVLEWIKNS